jgi:hypothetical protein
LFLFFLLIIVDVVVFVFLCLFRFLLLCLLKIWVESQVSMAMLICFVLSDFGLVFFFLIWFSIYSTVLSSQFGFRRLYLVR